MDIRKCLNYTLQLLNGIVKDCTVDLVINEDELKELFRFSETHNISNLLYLPLRKMQCTKESESIKLFEEAYYKNVIFSTQQHQYLEQITEAFENNGIKHMKMKGSVLKYLYPDVSLRTSCDVDIYIGDSDPEKAKNIMLELGFDAGIHDNVLSIPDTYHIDNRFHIELHRKLMQESEDFKGGKVCDDIENRLEQNADRQYEYKMTNEDFYVFMIIHIAKHIKAGGIGIRAFLDVWLYLEKYEGLLDWKKIKERFAKADLCEFHENVLLLMNVWAGKADSVPEHINKFQIYIANSGVLGNPNEEKSEKLYNQGKTKGKLSYYRSVIFLPMVHMREKYSILKKAPVLLPFCWIHRGIHTLFFKFKSIRTVLHHFDEADIKSGEESADLKNSIGL
ncbi:MAG: nucleotidyltransferase family protein [Oscillospiraceae bacterium]|nr:nucleotidyltransferase family protein [Oscillospiraceae bacterium]